MTQDNELIPNDNDRIVCLKVGKVLRENLYEMTRKYWVMKMERATKATHVLAIIDGVVAAVYVPNRWCHSGVKGKEHKLEFDGIDAPSSEYIGKSVNHYYGHSQNPIKYINM